MEEKGSSTWGNLESFCVLLLAKGQGIPVFLQFPACTVSFHSFANVILNNVKGRKGQPVYRKRALYADVPKVAPASLGGQCGDIRNLWIF